MIKDIPIWPVEEVLLAVSPQPGGQADQTWEVFMINLKDEPLRNVLIASRGYGERNGEPAKTSVLRQFFDEIGAQSYVRVEHILPEVLNLNNEFWISFTLGGQDYLFDRRYTFVTGSITPDHFTSLPLVGRRGVMIG
ncbi:MAG: hypothetical protein NW241_02970 [Bacteroidia bacterium]|nr:hypothetical protein [Bacteroidia bacterium]